ncbi:MAG: hypothetical protein HYV07_09480 [Deltaproteobacteria bacterium]|nr:hypothetical protein [Deltaproteobacteria bacterium]
MKASEAYADLRRFGKPVVTTEEVAARLRATLSAASRILAGLSSAGLVLALRRGLWSLDLQIDPLALPEYLTAPHPSYVSLQSALYFHDAISQIPRVVYVASLGRPRRVTTSIGTYSIHRFPPELFGGFATMGEPPVHLASPEKALVDLLYLSNVKSRLFAGLPELELPPRFRVREARRWVAAIPAPYRRVMVQKRLDALVADFRQGA